MEFFEHERKPKKTGAAPKDFKKISLHWFDTNDAASAIDSVVREVVAYQAGTSQKLSPSALRRKLEPLRSAAEKLKQHLEGIDTPTKLALFGRMPESLPNLMPASGPIAFGPDFDDAVPTTEHIEALNIKDKPTDLQEPSNVVSGGLPVGVPSLISLAGAASTVRASHNLMVCFALLDALLQSSTVLIEGIPPQPPGAPQAPDPILFGVECLAAIWERHRPDPPTSGFKRNRFGCFVCDVLGGPPVSASDTELRTALRKFFAREQAE